MSTKCVLSLAVLGIAAPAFAAPIGPGGTLFMAPGEAEPFVGSVLLASATLPFGTVFYTGSLTSYVLTNDLTSPFGANSLTFVFAVHNDPTSINALARLTVNGYAGFQTDASYSTLAGGTIPLFIDRQSNGDSLGFSFSNALGHSLVQPGTDTAYLIIQTNATLFRENIASVIDGAVTQVGTFSPVLPTPGALALAGIGALAAGRRRRA
jgi:MYXO-CTERM domain-containing protein